MIDALTIDVEEYFHPFEVHLTVNACRWDSLPSRAEYQPGRVLDRRHGVSATFFVLGWLAERQPRMVREIVERGHELWALDALVQMEFRFDSSRLKCRRCVSTFTRGRSTRNSRGWLSGLVSRLRTYTGIKSMESKLDCVPRMFEFSTISAAYGAAAESGTLAMAARAGR